VTRDPFVKTLRRESGEIKCLQDSAGQTAADEEPLIDQANRRCKHKPTANTVEKALGHDNLQPLALEQVLAKAIMSPRHLFLDLFFALTVLENAASTVATTTVPIPAQSIGFLARGRDFRNHSRKGDMACKMPTHRTPSDAVTWSPRVGPVLKYFSRKTPLALPKPQVTMSMADKTARVRQACLPQSRRGRTS
jgi:hypothetical protein